MAERVLTPEEVGTQIRLGMLQSFDVVTETLTLCRLLYGGLAADEGVQAWGAKGFRLPRDPKTSSPASRFMSADMGFVAAVDPSGDVVAREMEEPVEPDDPGDDDQGADDSRSCDVRPETRVLGVRVVLFDPKREHLDPTVFVGTFGGLTLQSRTAGRQANFEIKSVRLKRLAMWLGPDAVVGQGVEHKWAGRVLAATIQEQLTKPVAQFQSKGDVDQFVERILEVL